MSPSEEDAASLLDMMNTAIIMVVKTVMNAWASFSL